MRLQTHAIPLLIAALTATLFAAAAETPSNVTAPTTDPAVDAGWSDVLQKLASSEFAQREAAQQELDHTTYRQLDLLRKFAAAASDAEVQARVQGRISAIEEDMAINPPPISLNVTNASLADVGVALKSAMGVDVIANGVGPFTLNMQDKPFWDVYAGLTAQHGISMQMVDSLRLFNGDPGLRKMVTFGSVAVFPQSITRTKRVDLQRDPVQQDTNPLLSISYTVALDPRVKLAGVYQPQLLEVIDDAGNKLLNRPAAAQNFFRSLRNAGVWQLSESLALPPNIGTKIVSAKGQMRMRVMISEARMEVDAVETKVNQPFEIGGRTITFDRLDMKDTNLNVTITSKSTAGPENIALDPNGNPLRQDQSIATVTLFDANGTKIWTGTIDGTSGIGMGGAAYKTPLKAILSAPTKTKEVTVSFEMKDLPLP